MAIRGIDSIIDELVLQLPVSCLGRAIPRQRILEASTGKENGAVHTSPALEDHHSRSPAPEDLVPSSSNWVVGDGWAFTPACRGSRRVNRSPTTRFKRYAFS
jgi:hypothetical protein